MAYNDLRDWINTLQKAGELKRIDVEVDPNLEMAEIADRAAKMGRGTPKAGGPALLFENVKGYPGARVLMNQFGSERRMELERVATTAPPYRRPANVPAALVPTQVPGLAQVLNSLSCHIGRTPVPTL